jgi:hypothetical protein
MNVYLLTNTYSGAQALVFARSEHEARHRRPDGAVWRLGRWFDAGAGRMVGVLAWWPGSPVDVWVDPVLERIDHDAAAGSLPLVLAVKTGPSLHPASQVPPGG